MTTERGQRGRGGGVEGRGRRGLFRIEEERGREGERQLRSCRCLDSSRER